jgi:deoxycytidylate deaminase
MGKKTIEKIENIENPIISNNSNEQVEPCMNCKRLIMNAQIEKVICRQNDSKIVEFDPKKWIELV